jgi:hypothetical protein
MLPPEFHEAWVHAKRGHKILGRRLHPFCALDIVALEAVASPVLHEGAPSSAADLLLAIKILSHDHPRSCSIEGLEMTWRDRLWIWWLRLTGRLNVEEVAARLKAYLDDYYAVPDMMREQVDEPGLPYGTPWVLSVVMGVVKNLNVPLYDAWTMDAGKLLWYAGALEEATDSKARIVGKELREQMELAEKNGCQTFKVEPGETAADLARRIGVSEEDAAFLMDQARSTTSHPEHAHG